MKKILDILILFLLTVLVINLFANKSEKQATGNVIFEATDNAYTIPASVGLNIKNDTQAEISLHTCNDVKVNYAGTNVEFNNPMVSVKDDFCENVSIAPSSTYLLDYTNYYREFFQAGNYSFKVQFDEKEYISQFEIENPGTIRKLFTALFYAPIYNLLIFLTLLFHYSLGFGILAITVFLRLLLVYPQHRMMLSQKKLQAIQPKIKELQKQYKGQQQVLGMKLMELYKKEQVNPMGSLGFLLIQMPILIVIYNVIFHIKDPSNYYYIYSALNHFDLTKLSYEFFGMHLLDSQGIQGILLAVSVALIQFVQIKLSLATKNAESQKGVVLEKKKGEDSYSQLAPDPEMMNKFMLYGMPAMVAVFTYNLFAGIGFYWGISTLFMLFQQLFVNKMRKKAS